MCLQTTMMVNKVMRVASNCTAPMLTNPSSLTKHGNESPRSYVPMATRDARYGATPSYPGFSRLGLKTDFDRF